VIVARRELSSGGVGGFFARREIEVQARPSSARRFAAQLEEAEDELDVAPARPIAPGGRFTSSEVDALPGAGDDVFRRADSSPAPAAPTPAPASGLAALFDAGRQRPAVESDPVDLSSPAPAPAPAPEPAPAVPMADLPPAPGVQARAGIADPPAPAPAPVPVTVASPDPIGELPAPYGAAIEALVARGIEPGFAVAVAEQAAVALAPLAPGADPAALVREALARAIPTAALRRGGAVIALVGASGVGKTRCVARLAAAHSRHGDLPVSVLALRSADEGAELKRLLAPYGVQLHAVESGAEGAGHLPSSRAEGLVIVDTPGFSPRAPGELRALEGELRALAPDEVHLAVPATIAPAPARELVAAARELGVQALVVTHVDETEQLGTLVGLSVDSGLPLSYLARGQAVDAGLRPVAATELAAALLP
jgi:hypothetical protein